ncbi:hypothetical protein ACFSCV_17605 [Methylopila henanensis]|uniref:HTH HARE-type domain-containing protein n=1 Tax=Methylopila henanensis TaxID=873516 RepID=A0ABW4K9G6_9HYPH
MGIITCDGENLEHAFTGLHTAFESIYKGEMETSPVALIKVRRFEVEREIAELTERLQSLKAELPELDVAERVLSRISGEAGHSVGHGDPTPPARSATTKPEGAPTVPEMILTLLKEARAEGRVGLEPREMVQRVARRWWPDVRTEAVGSIAWRMWKREQLRKDGPVYMLPDTNKGSDTDASEPSEVPSSRSDNRGDDLI